MPEYCTDCGEGMVPASTTRRGRAIPSFCPRCVYFRRKADGREQFLRGLKMVSGQHYQNDPRAYRTKDGT